MLNIFSIRLMKPCFIACLGLSLLATTVYAEEVPATLRSSEAEKSFFQQVANRWTTGTDSNSPAILKGLISASQDEYRLGRGDTITVSIPNLFNAEGGNIWSSQDVVIRDNGEATIVPFGTFMVAGMTSTQVSNMIEEMSSYYLVNPRALVALKSLRPYTVYMTGEIGRPGGYQTVNVPEAASQSGKDIANEQFYEPRLSIMIEKAGGLRINSDVAHIKVTNPRTHKDITINLLDLLHGDSTQDVLLEADDVVFVPTNNDLELPAEVVASTMGNKASVVRVVGYIQKTTNGANDVTLDPRSMTALNALSRVNTDPQADLKHLYVLRKRKDSDRYDKFAFNGLKEDFPLKPNDVLVVPHLRKLYQLTTLFGVATSGVANISVIGR